jgi:hypothetical protein
MKPRFLQTVAFVIGSVVVSLTLTSCNSKKADPNDPSIMLDEQAVDPKVENGSAYDRAMIDLGNIKKIVLPDNASVRALGKTGELQLLIIKTLNFSGHPPRPMSVRDARKNMGLATRTE